MSQTKHTDRAGCPLTTRLAVQSNCSPSRMLKSLSARQQTPKSVLIEEVLPVDALYERVRMGVWQQKLHCKTSAI